MSIQTAQLAANAGPERQGYVRLKGSWPLIVRGLWVVTVTFLLIAFFTTLPRVVTQMRTPCQPGACPWLQYTTTQIEAINQSLIPYNAFIAATMVLGCCSLVVSWAVSAVIIWRRPDDWMAALVAFSLLFNGTTLTTTSVPIGSTPWLNLNAYALAFLTAALPAVFCLFPSGRFAPRWTRWLLIMALAAQIPIEFIPNSPTAISTPVGPIGWVLTATELLALAVGQIYRYRVVSTPIERQQTKWALVGFATPVAVIATLIAATLLFAALGTSTSPIALLYPDVGFLLPIGMAIGFGFAMMRSRLWEIDALINRALIYGALTLILTTAYAGLVIGLQTSLHGVIGQDNSVAIVISTLAIAALVLPLRQRLQTFIDRRFYRHKYDAAKTLEAFSATLRDEVRAEALRERLLDVVDEAMQPTHVSLWLRPLSQDSQSGA
jgi:hypothetical protein